jgi:hypothetical protein
MLHPPPEVRPIQNEFAFNSMEAQCENHISHDPDHPRCARGLGNLYMQLGDNGRARKWIAFYLNHAVEPDLEEKAIYARLLASGK